MAHLGCRSALCINEQENNSKKVQTVNNVVERYLINGITKNLVTNVFAVMSRSLFNVFVVSCILSETIFSKFFFPSSTFICVWGIRLALLSQVHKLVGWFHIITGCSHNSCASASLVGCSDCLCPRTFHFFSLSLSLWSPKTKGETEIICVTLCLRTELEPLGKTPGCASFRLLPLFLFLQHSKLQKMCATSV